MLTPMKAIRAKCLECCYEQVGEVRLCESSDCPLWAYRMGHNPNRKRNLSDEQRQAIGERLNRRNEEEK